MLVPPGRFYPQRRQSVRGMLVLCRLCLSVRRRAARPPPVQRKRMGETVIAVPLCHHGTIDNSQIPCGFSVPLAWRRRRWGPGAEIRNIPRGANVFAA
jgi:hypothetical protein